MNNYLQLRLNQACENHRLYATEGAAFGPLLGTSFVFPKKPEFWTLAQLEAFRTAQLERVKGEGREQLAKMWLKVIHSRQHMLGKDFSLRQHPFIKTPEGVKAEFLTLEPEIARPALSAAVSFSNPELALAGHDLYWALDALLQDSTCPNKPCRRSPIASWIPLDVSSLQALEVGESFRWPLDIQVSRHSKTQFVVYPGELVHTHVDLQRDSEIWLTTKAGYASLERFLEALMGFYRESLLARMTIGITMPGSSVAVTLESRPIEGLIVEKNAAFHNLMYLDMEAEGANDLRRTTVAPCEGLRVAMLQDSSHRDALVERVLGMWNETFRTFPFTFHEHLWAVKRLAQVEPALSSDDQATLLREAKAAFSVVDEHVQQRDDGRYVVTRHDMIRPIPLAISDDVEFAISLAIAHEEAHPWRLSLATRPSAA
jgi:hypothetical protein